MIGQQKENTHKSKDLTDNELVSLVAGGESEKYSEIIQRYQGKLFAYLFRLIGNREDAEDILQDVFVKAFRNLNSFDVDRKFSSWIYRIAHNEAVNYIKRKSLKRFISWESVVSTKDQIDSSSTEEGADKVWIKKEISKEVEEAINKLSFKYKQVLVLRYYEDKSYEEIGEILGKPVNTVGTLIKRAKEKLSTQLKGFKM
jgi:RNA polymerase sigma-70 factor, ECF subfamily